MIATGHDIAALAAAFRQHRRLHLPGFLDPAEAARIAAALRGPVPWVRSVLLNAKPYDIGLQTLASMEASRAQEMAQAIATAARSGFQYQFDAWRISDLLDAGGAAPSGLQPLADLYAALNGAPFLEFVAALSGEGRCEFADAQATRYRAGDFLTAHDDDVDGKSRVLAYVLNFSEGWRPDWGGLLLFHGPNGEILEGYPPAFNSLNIFRVPMVHAVSQVASFVTADRLCLTGWIRHR